MAADARVIDMSDLKDLEPLSKKLNTASDELSRTLQVIQDRLNDLGIGLEVWLDSEPLKQTGWSDILDRDNDPTGAREYLAEELGYGRHGDGWALLIRSRRYVERPGVGGFPEVDTYDTETQTIPLLKASRTARVSAVPLIPHLIDVIKVEAERVINSVEQAKKIADSLK